MAKGCHRNLFIALDSSLYIIPALKILDPEQKIDCKWAVNDLTHFPKTSRSPENATPGCVIWWQTLECNQNAIIGYDTGELCFVSLTDGQVIGTTQITGPVTSLNICQDNSLDAVTLLITSESKQQWRLLLEQRSKSYIWSQEGLYVSKLFNADVSSNSSLSSSDNDPKVARSRLQGLKQMSVDKLTSLKQKLADSRAGKSMNRKDSSSSFGSRKLSNTDLYEDASAVGMYLPEKLINMGETFLRPQFAKNRHLFSGYFNPTSLLTVSSI